MDTDHMNETPFERVAVTKALARRFVERSESLKYKGKKRDDAALDYFCGAAVLAEEMGNDAMGEHLARICVLMISVRGYIAIKELAQ